MSLQDIKQTLRNQNRALKCVDTRRQHIAFEALFVYADDEGNIVHARLMQPYSSADDSRAVLTPAVSLPDDRLSRILDDRECEMVPLADVTRVVSSTRRRVDPDSSPSKRPILGKEWGDSA